MFYYAEIDGEYRVIDTHSLATSSTNENYIAITEEQYTSGEIVGKYYNSFYGRFEIVDWMNYMGNSDFVTHYDTQMLLSTKIDNMQMEINSKADADHTHEGGGVPEHNHEEYALVAHTHSEYATVNELDVLMDTVNGKAAFDHTHDNYANSNHSHTEYAGVNHSHTEYMVLPTITSDDNGKVLMVVNGQWQAVTLNLLIDSNGTVSI